jgi:predicted N-acetyltransferase YhbS
MDIIFAEKNIAFANLADAKAINVLVNSAYRGDSSKKGWTTEADLLDGIRTSENELSQLLQKKDSYFLMYVLDDKILGSVFLEKKESYLYLGMLTVQPDLQATGIGAKLLAAAEEFALFLALKKIRMTAISVRTELIAYYERKGYQQTGEREPFPMDDPDFGLPKQPLEFLVLEKSLNL